MGASPAGACTAGRWSTRRSTSSTTCATVHTRETSFRSVTDDMYTIGYACHGRCYCMPTAHHLLIHVITCHAVTSGDCPPQSRQVGEGEAMGATERAVGAGVDPSMRLVSLSSLSLSASSCARTVRVGTPGVPPRAGMCVVPTVCSTMRLSCCSSGLIPQRRHVHVEVRAVLARRLRRTRRLPRRRRRERHVRPRWHEGRRQVGARRGQHC